MKTFRFFFAAALGLSIFFFFARFLVFAFVIALIFTAIATVFRRAKHFLSDRRYNHQDPRFFEPRCQSHPDLEFARSPAYREYDRIVEVY